MDSATYIITIVCVCCCCCCDQNIFLERKKIWSRFESAPFSSSESNETVAQGVVEGGYTKKEEEEEEDAINNKKKSGERRANAVGC